jgi:glycosyltransferase involved in cell wall biosynthesis
VKIGYVIQEGVDIRRPPFNGPANHVREVVEAMTRRGHEVRALVRFNGSIWRSDGLANFRPVTARWLDRGVLRLVERLARRIQSELHLPYAAWFESQRFSQACVQEMAGCDLIYERISWVSYGASLASRRLDVPLVLEDNGDHLFDLEAKGMAPTGLQRRISLSMMGRAVERAAHVISSGAGWREQFIRRWDYDPDRVTTVENGTTLVHVLDRKQLRSFSGDAPANDPITLVYVGGFYPWHGVPILLEAFARARAQRVNAKLLMIGSGEGFADAQRQAARLNLNGDVTLTGHLQPSQYAPLLAGADVGLSPYFGWPEFSGLKVLDYKAAGLPTIGSGINGHPPTLTQDKTGLIVTPGDVDALCQAIVRLCSDATLRRCMGRTARIEAEAMHAWEHTAARLEQIFRRVVSERRAS